jgi:hypothetical protein
MTIQTFIFSKGQRVHLDEIYNIQSFTDGFFEPCNEYGHQLWDADMSDTFICKKDFKLSITITKMKQK